MGIDADGAIVGTINGSGAAADSGLDGVLVGEGVREREKVPERRERIADRDGDDDEGDARLAPTMRETRAPPKMSPPED